MLFNELASETVPFSGKVQLAFSKSIRYTPIGANDLWIACHALAIGATVVSHNVSEFSRIEGLPLVDWAA